MMPEMQHGRKAFTVFAFLANPSPPFAKGPTIFQIFPVIHNLGTSVNQGDPPTLLPLA